MEENKRKPRENKRKPEENKRKQKKTQRKQKKTGENRRKPEKTPGKPRSGPALLNAMSLVSKARTARNPCDHSAMHSALSFQWLEAPAIFHPWSHMDAIGIMRSSSHLH